MTERQTPDVRSACAPPAHMSYNECVMSTLAVFLDLYETVARFDPPREELQIRACSEFGIAVDPVALQLSYPVADELLSRENGHLPLYQRSPERIAEFWARYQQLLMAQAGVEVSMATAMEIFQMLRRYNYSLALFDDVLPTLHLLRERNYTLGLLSNLDDDLDRISSRLGLAPYLDFTITSSEVGAAKPNPPIFLEALRRADVQANQAVHVGDQFHSDLIGAKGVGIRAILLDRGGIHTNLEGWPIIQSLIHLPELLGIIDGQP